MDELLSLLSFDEFVSGEAISEALGMTRAAVWKRIEAFRRQGIPIESGGKKGYRLERDGESLNPLYWARPLNLPPVLYQREMTSTNTFLKGHPSAPHLTVALCDRQTQGRGRLDRNWETPDALSQLTVSILLRPRIETEKAPLFTLLVGLSMAQALEAFGLTVGIKWPNDLVIGGKKICGILLEMAADMDGIRHIIVGTGVNVSKDAYPDTLASSATSLEEHLAKPVSRQAVLVSYIKTLKENLSRFEQGGFLALKDAYEKRCVTLNSTVKVIGKETFWGVAESLDETGALIVKDQNNVMRRVIYGDVSVRGVMGYV